MAVTLAFIEYGNTAITTSIATQLNMDSTASANLAATLWPVSVGNYGMSKVFRLQFNDTFTNVSAIKMYISADTQVKIGRASCRERV